MSGYDPQFFGKTGAAYSALAGHGAHSVTSSATQITGTPTVFDGGILLVNTDTTNTVYIGKDDTVTGPGSAATCGIALLPGQPAALPPGDISALWFIATAGSPVLTWGGWSLNNPVSS